MFFPQNKIPSTQNFFFFFNSKDSRSKQTLQNLLTLSTSKSKLIYYVGGPQFSAEFCLA